MRILLKFNIFYEKKIFFVFFHTFLNYSGYSILIKRSTASGSALWSIKYGIIYSAKSFKSSYPSSFSYRITNSSPISFARIIKYSYPLFKKSFFVPSIKYFKHYYFPDSPKTIEIKLRKSANYLFDINK